MAIIKKLKKFVSLVIAGVALFTLAPAVNYVLAANQPSPASDTAQSPRRPFLDAARFKLWEREIRQKPGENLSYVELMKRQHQMILSDLKAAEDDDACSYEEWSNGITKAFFLIQGYFIIIQREASFSLQESWEQNITKTTKLLKQTKSKKLKEFYRLADEVRKFRQELTQKLPALDSFNKILNTRVMARFYFLTEDLTKFSKMLPEYVDLWSKIGANEIKISVIRSESSAKSIDIRLEQMNAATSGTKPQLLTPETQQYMKTVDAANETLMQLGEEYQKTTTIGIPFVLKEDVPLPGSDPMANLQKLAASLKLSDKLMQIDPYLPVNGQMAEAQRICKENNAIMPPEHKMKFYLLSRLEEIEKSDSSDAEKLKVTDDIYQAMDIYFKALLSRKDVAPNIIGWKNRAPEWIQPLADASLNGSHFFDEALAVLKIGTGDKVSQGRKLVLSARQSNNPSETIKQTKFLIHQMAQFLTLRDRFSHIYYMLRRYVNTEKKEADATQNKTWQQAAQRAVNEYTAPPACIFVPPANLTKAGKSTTITIPNNTKQK